jgi:ATP-dependent DNA helicase RecG
LTPLNAADGTLVEIGLVEQALDFVRRNTTPTAYLEGGRRIDRTTYPEAVVREAVVNALVHRDYSIAGSDITLLLFTDRLEILSPGRLPNTVSVEGMKAGLRYARNQNLVNVMRDYRYVDFRGMGVRDKLIPGMRQHNGTEPDLIAEEFRFTVRLWKDPKPTSASLLEQSDRSD